MHDLVIASSRSTPSYLSRLAFRSAFDSLIYSNIVIEHEANPNLISYVRAGYETVSSVQLLGHFNDIVLNILNNARPEYGDLQDELDFKKKSYVLVTNNYDELVYDAIGAAEIFHTCLPIKSDKSIEEIELEIVNTFKKVPEISAIYTQTYRAELQTTVFLSLKEYDNLLIHDLLDMEYDLQNKFPNPRIAISYIPGLNQDRRTIVHPHAKLIYDKIHG